MNEKLVEETLLELGDLKVSNGPLKRFERCTEGLLTTFKLTYKREDGTRKSLFISSITDVKFYRRFLQEYVLLESGSVRYYVSCSDNDLLYSEFLKVLKLNESGLVLNSPRSVAGISRILSCQQEKFEEAEGLQSSLLDLETLKKKCSVVKDVLVKLNTYDKENFKTGINQLFQSLGLDLYSLPEETCDSDTLEHIRNLVRIFLDKNQFLLLYEFYCVCNRLMLKDLLTPNQLMNYLRTLETEGMCTVYEMGGVYILTKCHDLKFKEELCKDLSEILEKGPVDISTLSNLKGISLNMAQFNLDLAEKIGIAVKDYSIQKTSYFYNHFNNYKLM